MMSDDAPTDDPLAPATLRLRLENIRERVELACERAGRDRDEVTLLAISKTFPAEVMRVLYDEGVRDFGESYVQEWQDKFEQLPEDVRWHFVGHLQSNKAKHLADRVHMIHSIDRKSVIKKLNRRADDPVRVLLQVNVAGDEAKSGVAPEGLERLLEMATARPALRVWGLMTLPPYADDPEDNRTHFAKLAQLRERAHAWLVRKGLDEEHPCADLSMGMTHDFEVAIEQGATLVRVGSGLFGPRHYDD